MAGLKPRGRFEAVLWDLDGTLLETRGDIATGVNLVLAERGLPPMSTAAVCRNVGQGTRILLARCLEQSGLPSPDDVEIDRLYQSFLRHYGEHLFDSTVPYDGIPALLEQLAEIGIPMGLVSNKPEDPCLRLLERFGLRRFFDVVLGGDSVGERKPHPDQLVYAIEAIGGKRDSVVMVGDSQFDLMAAEAAGIPSVAVTWGFVDAEVLRRASPNHLVGTPAELKRLLIV